MVLFMFIQRPFPATPKGSMWLKGLVNFAKKLGFGCSEHRLQLGSSAQACSSAALSPTCLAVLAQTRLKLSYTFACSIMFYPRLCGANGCL